MVMIGACATSGRELPPETEAEVGRQLSDDLDRQMFLLRDTVITTPLATVGRGLGANALYSIAPYSFRVVDGETVNAFAIAGGSIYLYRGLIEESSSMGEIAAVLAHEIAHLAAGLLRFFEILMELREDRPSVLVSPFLTHPEIEERMESVRRVIDRLPPDDLAGLRESSAAYDGMIAELDELPPAHESEFRQAEGPPPFRPGSQ